VFRSLLSSGLVVALVIVLTAGSCLACSSIFARQTMTCCSQADHCKMPGKAPLKTPVHQHCSTPAADLSTIQVSLTLLSSDVGGGAAEAAVAAHLPAPAAFRVMPADTVPPYSPPDLYLRNSVLTI
jgi:hypothetical protein